MARNENRTVYTTEQGRICPKCGQPVANCTCGKTKGAARPLQGASRPLLGASRGDGIARVRVESKGRKGKTVTTISGLLLDELELKKLVSELKQSCGAGGAVKEGVIEVQGDHAAAILDALKKRGFTAKRAGG